MILTKVAAKMKSPLDNTVSTMVSVSEGHEILRWSDSLTQKRLDVRYSSTSCCMTSSSILCRMSGLDARVNGLDLKVLVIFCSRQLVMRNFRGESSVTG
jgi:hypothetical protein